MSNKIKKKKKYGYVSPSKKKKESKFDVPPRPRSVLNFLKLDVETIKQVPLVALYRDSLLELEWMKKYSFNKKSELQIKELALFIIKIKKVIAARRDAYYDKYKEE